eukprot:12184748-Karenia_brevis.AAC.1
MGRLRLQNFALPGLQGVTQWVEESAEFLAASKDLNAKVIENAHQNTSLCVPTPFSCGNGNGVWNVIEQSYMLHH